MGVQFFKTMGWVCLIWTLSACSENSQHSKAVGDDVIVRYSDEALTPGDIIIHPTDLQQCREHISKILCLSTKISRPGHTPGPQDECSSDNQKYIQIFQNHFDRSPDAIKKMYCYLDSIWIESALASTAYASPRYDSSGKIMSGAVGIRREMLDSTQSFDDILSWKEETTYGGSSDSNAPRLGVVTYESNMPEHDHFIDYVLTHEFAHLFDFANQVNRFDACSGHSGCHASAGSWGEFSWLTTSQIKPAADFPLRSKLCFYSCGGDNTSPQLAPQIFAGFMTSTFASTYASVNSMEEFAEVFALTIAHEKWGYRWSAKVQGQSFDLSAHFLSEALRPKREYVEKFLQSPLRYPGEK